MFNLGHGRGVWFPFKSAGAQWEITCHLCYMFPLVASVLIIDLADPNLGMGASGTQASGGAVVPKGTNKRRAP